MEIFVGNLPESATAEGLNALFGGYGDGSGFLVINRVLRDGHRLRFAFGVITPEAEARRAIRERHLCDYQGKRLLVLERVHRDFRTERRKPGRPFVGRERRGRELWLIHRSR